MGVSVLPGGSFGGSDAAPIRQGRDEGEEGWEEEEDWEEEDWEEEEEGAGRWFLYSEAVFSAFYTAEGAKGIPPDDSSEDHVEFSPRPPGNYIGLDYVETFASSSLPNRVLPGWLPLKTIDLHPRLLFDPVEESDSPNQIKLIPQDFWARFNPGEIDRLTLRVGQFVIPYGVHPILAPRQRFILPLEATDLGFKWDWGVDLKGPVGEYDWEVAATLGTGEAFHTTNLLGGPDHTSYLLTGRIGTPTYRDLQGSFSFLYGELPLIRGPNISRSPTISRWRMGLDSSYKYGTYLMAGAQLTFGQDGFAGDAVHVPLSEGETANALGYRAWADWVVPWHDDLRLAIQFESVIRNLARSDSDSTAFIWEMNYSLTTTVSLMIDYRVELSRPVGERFDAVFLTLVYYGL